MKSWKEVSVFCFCWSVCVCARRSGFCIWLHYSSVFTETMENWQPVLFNLIRTLLIYFNLQVSFSAPIFLFIYLFFQAKFILRFPSDVQTSQNSTSANKYQINPNIPIVTRPLFLLLMDELFLVLTFHSWRALSTFFFSSFQLSVFLLAVFLSSCNSPHDDTLTKCIILFNFVQGD